MTEPIEQLVVRLAGTNRRLELRLPDPALERESRWLLSEADLIELAKACMLHQAKADAEICKSVSDDPGPGGAYECWQYILKAAEGLRG